MSRLRIAWGVLIGGVAALMVAAVLAPAPTGGPDEVTFELPGQPDAYAVGPARAGTEVAAAPPGAGADADGKNGREGNGREGNGGGERALPRIVFQDDGTARAENGPGIGVGEGAGEGDGVVITMADGAPAAPPRAGRPAVPPGAPDPALTARTPSGTRPAISAKGRTPFSAYRRLEAVGDRSGVAVIVSGLGLDPALTEAAVGLPPSITLAFAPYARDLPAQIERAREAGHEVAIELPMGTPGVAAAALGPAGLLSARSPAANDKRLEWVLTRAPAYPMVTNYLGRGFSADERAMARVMLALSGAGLAYVDDTGLARNQARAAGVPYAATDLLIEPSLGDPADALRRLTARAARGEVVLAKVYADSAAVDAVSRWARSLPDGTVLVPASSAIRAR